MALYRLLTDEEDLSNFFIRTACSEDRKDLLLPWSQSLLRFPGSDFPSGIDDGLSLKESGHQFALNPKLPLVDGLNCLDEIGDACVLREVSLGPRLQGFENHVFIHSGGKHECFGIWAFFSDCREGFNAIHLGHYDIEEDDIRLKIADDIDCLEHIGRLAHDFDAIFLVQGSAEHFPD